MPYEHYEAQAANAARRRKVADELAAMSSRPMQQQVAPGGLVVPLGLAQLAEQLGGAFFARRADKKAKKAEDEATAERDAGIAAAVEQYRGSVPDEQVGATARDRLLASSDDELMEPVVGRTEATDRLMGEVMSPQQRAQMMVAQAMAPEEDYTLGAGEQRMRGGRVLASAPFKPEPEQGPDLPTGMRMGANGQPEWIPGYIEAQEKLRSAGASRINVGVQDQQRENELQRAETGVQDIERIFSLMDDGGPLPDVELGSWLKNIVGTDAHNIDRLLVGIKGGIAVDQLQAMRAASPTGGALGNVTERELEMLQSLRGSLDQGQRAPQFRDNLARYQNALLDVIHGPGQGPPRRDLTFQQQQPSAPADPLSTLTPEQRAKYGL